MIDKMTKYSFILLNEETDAFIDAIQGLGVIDITRSMKPVDSESEAMLEEVDGLGRTIRKISGMDFSKESLPEVRIEDGDRVAEMDSELSRLDNLTGRISLVAKELEDRRVWGEFDAKDIAKLNDNGFKLHFYSVPAKKFEPEWEQEYALQKVEDNGKYVWFVTVSKAGEAYDFPIAECAAPGESFRASENSLDSLNKELADCKARIMALKAFIPEVGEKRRKLSADLDSYLAKAGSGSTAENRVTVFEGYAPLEDDGRLEKALDDMDVIYIKEKAAVEDNPPIKLKNNRFVKMFEVLTDMYGRPSYDGFDPTPYISIFFLLFFAMCMGDCGYGIILVVLGFLLKKVDSFKKFAPLVSVLGIATIVVGFVFHTFFSIDISSWAVIPDFLKKIMLPSKIAGYDGTMVAALVIGVIHLCLAMIVKTVNATRTKGFLESLGTWGWTVFIVGCVAAGAAALAGVIDATATKWIIIVLGIVSALGIFLFNNIHRNPLLNVGSGLWDTYNTATGLLGDVLSYLRLYALGLAGSMLGFAFNDLAKMALGDGGFGWIPFILIVLVGHTLNLAMAALGAFVHPLRLNFLEFFKNSGYEGSGRVYQPLKK